ncbi:metallophosphoesterase [Gottfriedia solisilvae]|uniref:Metallophosphoesterase n=1 Tax=Gottfriedia solisilvae TaxID=1516104 RepID=A0A8J3F2D4_9BACI|nr:metallophosphoesterase [Gottfriedia solisilvae]GGI18262.1 metallophosphoesterase [Gottfriedia solisilvae]
MIYLILVLSSFCMILLFYMYKEAHLNIIRKHEFSFSTTMLDKPLRIFFISDIHRRFIHPTLIKKMKNKVDLVIIGGDLLEKGVPFHRVESNIETLKSLGPLYFVWGNNDQENGLNGLMAIFEKFDVRILKNEATLMMHQLTEWTLIGVDDLNTGHIDINRALHGKKETGFKLLVSHNPRVMELIQDEHKISLVLSGHTHGGQIRILGFGPYEKGKVHMQNGITQIVSNGYGTTGIPLRLGAKPETHYIVIKSL